MDIYKITAILIAVFSIAFNIYQFRSKRSKFKFHMKYDFEPNEDGVGNFLCARLFVSNIGGEVAVYNGLESIDDKGNIGYPSCSIKIGEKVEPNSSVVGYIFNGHLLTHGTSKLFIIDGVLKRHRVPKKLLKKLMDELQSEKDRLESLGLEINPPSIFKKHNKAFKPPSAGTAKSAAL